MAEIHHFQHGWVTPTVSYILSVLGSLLGLICAVRLRQAPTAGWRAWWLTMAALAIGGTGIWTMHFVAMMGFSVVGLPIRYDVGLTAASAGLAIGAVGIGLFIVMRGTKAKTVRVIVGGLFAGLGVAAMHFTGMYAMHLDGTITYLPSRVIAAVIIAVVAATVALWLTVTVQKPSAIAASALVMGIAVNGMHFTGMSAMSVRPTDPSATLTGATGANLLIPIGLLVIFGVLGLAYTLMAAPTDEDRAGAAYLASRQNPAARPSDQPPNQSPAVAAPPPAATPFPGAPPQQLPSGRRMPSANSSWTYRDRSSR